MIVLAGADLVLPDRVLSGASLVLDGHEIVDIDRRGRVAPDGAEIIDVAGGIVVPGFIDVHVHGVEGHDTLDGSDAVREIASRLPRYGVTSFCPTSVACGPRQLQAFCDQVRRARITGARGARVLPAHLESNFINPDYRGAQPEACLRLPAPDAAARDAATANGDFSATDLLTVIGMARAEIAIVTIAPELPGGLDLVHSLVGAGHRVSLGHSGADFDTAIAAIEAGARHATHLFNRMTPLTHRAPGLAGAVLSRQDIAAELICDGFHVHPAMCRVAIAAKGVDRILAISDGTAGAGLAPGGSARLGGRPIQVRAEAAFLDDGTLAGSTLTMDRAFRNIVGMLGGSLIDAARMCATNPARELEMSGVGAITEGHVADLVVLDRDLQVAHTFVEGIPVYQR
jgi:N-acetylglucosamine-6-phosphate deacetylase